ncbi:nonstructural protein P9-1 [Maize rough dwarf virus]|uniref:Nonstructural protein P9-1 n=1 Tax=Maize rough dwarf virus TaxID=10989 RepID=A0A173DQH1_MRDV|nr:nonstructural protein P9-1 [Maize rough dwarf virus]ANG56331.1 nonstructural protein P9-1 [Maize rough dwarf virus]
MADQERRTFGSYKIEELTIKNDQPNRNTNTSNSQSTENRLSTKKIPLLDDGIFELLNYLIDGTNFDKTCYCGFNYSHLPNLERDFNVASIYVRENFELCTEHLNLKDYDRQANISVKSPDFTLFLEYIVKPTPEPDSSIQEKDKDEASKQTPPKVADVKEEKITVEMSLLPILNRESEESLNSEILDGEAAVVNVFKMYIKGFLMYLGENPNSYDRQLNIEKYRPLLISILGYEHLIGTKVPNKEVNQIFYQLATFDNYPFDLLRFQLSSLISTPALIREKIAKEGLFKVITSNTLRGAPRQTVLFRGINGSESFLNMKRYRRFRTRIVGNVACVIKSDFSSLKLDV